MGVSEQVVPVYWAPDLFPDWNVNPGVLVSVSDAYPTKMKTLRGYQMTGNIGITAAVATYGTPLYARIFRDTSDVGHMVYGTTTRLMNPQDFGFGAAFVDRSKGGAAYTTATDWSFCMWGNKIYAFSKANTPQVSTISAGAMGTFADLGGTPPKASLCAVNMGFVMLGDTNDGVDDLADRWWCSAWQDPADYVPSMATESAYGYCRDTNGPLRALEPQRDTFVFYKADSIYVLNYVGPSNVFSTRCVAHSVGCAAPHGVAVFGDDHYFLHATGIYKFDGQAVTPLAGEKVSRFIKETFSSNGALYSAHATVDEHEGVIIWYLRNNTSTTAAFTNALAYNIFTGQLGWIITPWASYTMTGAVRASTADCIQWDGGYGQNSATKLHIAGVGHASGNFSLAFASVNGDTSTFKTGHMGSDTKFAQSIRVTPRAIRLSGLSSATDYNRKSMWDASPTSTTMTADSAARALYSLQSNRWHQIQFSATDIDLAGLTIEGVAAGHE